MTNGRRRVRVLQLPSRNAQAWRHAMRTACDAAGWTFTTQDPEEPVPILDPERDSLVIGWIDHVPENEITDWLIQAASPAEVAFVLQEAGYNRHDSLHNASLRLGAASSMALNGCAVASAYEPVFDIPGLGPVALPHPPLAALTTLADDPLAIFALLPPEPRVRVRWKPEIFSYHAGRLTDEPGVFPLLGRRRLLLNGPNIHLPPGRWRFTAEFSVDPASQADLLLEWGYGEEVISFGRLFETAGRYEVEFVRDWPSVTPADFRISLMMPALAGHFSFHGGTLEQV